MRKINLDTAGPEEIREHIFAVIAEVSGLDPSDLELGLSISEDIAPNSIDRITLFMALEDEFERSIPESEVADINTLNELIEFVELKVNELKSAV